MPSARVLLLLAPLALAACANPQNELALGAPRALVGLAEADLLACAGVPESRTVGPSGNELVYTRTQTIVERDVDYDDSLFGRRVPSILRRPVVTTWTRTFTCRAVVTVRDERVAALTYNPDRDISLCYDILQACLPPAR